MVMVSALPPPPPPRFNGPMGIREKFSIILFTLNVVLKQKVSNVPRLYFKSIHITHKENIHYLNQLEQLHGYS